MAPQKDVLGYIAYRRDVFGIGLKTYNCNYFIMESHLNCMLVCDTGEMMVVYPGVHGSQEDAFEKDDSSRRMYEST